MKAIFFRNRARNPIDIIKNELKKREKSGKKVPLTREEARLLQEVRKKTAERNKNNVARTQAYFDFYQQHPEVHWAFLGHMVSRNGGWNMTDLKGELLMHLLTKQEKESFFLFLERGNWLIFQDAYPQFLLYEESKKRNEPFFYLCPYLNISLFMEVIWQYFWKKQDFAILTIALIINEQNYLEKRVVQNTGFQKAVLNTPEFKLQEFFSFNQILFPYHKNDQVMLIGQTLKQFGSLTERIQLGKRLYALLFQDQERLRCVENWAARNPHTGSRKDYWPEIFHPIREGLPGKYQLHLKGCKLRPGASRIYSPYLENAWKNVEHLEVEQGDWYENGLVADMLDPYHEKVNGEIESEYCKTLERLELAALAKKAMSLID
ncbi:DUF2515 family protein [Neobacillus sp. SM06]|uniref:DUF2515 family protein n=1 Tax=Neobacillus sp. SM06 TaxID=3422492 RepID=UPI003D2BDB42